MEDLLVKYAPQFVTITAIAMLLTQLVPLPLGRKADKQGSTLVERNGTRRPISAFVYSFALNLGGWLAGVLVNLPTPLEGIPPMLGNVAFLALMSGGSVATAHALVRGKKRLSP